MKRLLLLAGALLVIAACSNKPTARISATIEGAADTTVVIAKLNYNKLVLADTIKTDAAGHFDCKLQLKGNEPYFYYIYLGDSQLAALVLLDGDKVKVTASTLGGYTVEGSEESVKFQELNTMYGKAYNRLDALARQALSTPEGEKKQLNGQLGQTYIDYRREVTTFVMNNPYSICSAVAMFQKFNDNLPVFGETADMFLYSRVCDSLATVYPNSEYIAALRDEIEARGGRVELQNKIDNVLEIGFPEISLPDIDGNVKTLSDLKGKVIIVNFWTVGQDEHKIFNNDLVELYAKYHGNGLEIYQVSLDIDKPSWAATVKSQKLPWICVSDGLGLDSPAVASYNLQNVPAMYLIDRQGDVVAVDLFDADKLEAAVKKIL